MPNRILEAPGTEPAVVVDRTLNAASIEIDLESSRNVTEEDQLPPPSSSSEFNTGAEHVIQRGGAERESTPAASEQEP